ncbi:PRD domain-containing protein [Schnuerera sp. xch1]|uniref:BglG family transcription antiterminator n=1 Tax=Schnuerera sp. xch1 TaxID=2874283 RepID=UPI001CBF3DA0|nr:PRD domain-containing protein [Schnuerera sp. xch1]MBZ2175374.1 PRD domain-containing protein [Schnuerera sp. xch1]
MNKRQVDLLKQLITQDEYLPIKYFSNIFNISTKTISKDLNKIEEIIKPTGATIDRKQGLGIKLHYTPLQLDRLNTKLNSIEVADGDNSLEHRRAQILLNLLINTNKYITIQKLSDKYMVSRTSITNDLNEIAEKLDTYNIRLSKTAKGTRIVGSEINIRRALVTTIQEYSKINPNYITEYQNIRHNELKINEINAILNEESTSFFENLLNRMEKKLKLVIYEPYYTNLLTHLVIMINRIMSGNYIQGNSDLNDMVLVMNKELYNIATYMIREIEKKFKIKINTEEVGYVYKYLTSIGLSYDENNEKSYNGLDLPPIHFTNNLIDIVSQMSDTNYNLRFNLYDRLLLHIKPMLNRLKYNIQVKNPLLKDFLREFQEEFLIIKVACFLICRKFKINMVIDDEVAYILSYFISEHEKIEEDIKVKALVVCHSGYGTSQLLATRLEKTFSNIKVVDIISSNSINNSQLDEIDLIISTVDLNIKNPHLVVSAFLSEIDKKNIENFIDIILENKKKPSFKSSKETILLEYVDDREDLKQLSKSFNKDDLIHIKNNTCIYLISDSNSSIRKYLYLTKENKIEKCIFVINYSSYRYLSKVLRKIIRE